MFLIDLNAILNTKSAVSFNELSFVRLHYVIRQVSFYSQSDITRRDHFLIQHCQLGKILRAYYLPGIVLTCVCPPNIISINSSNRLLK